MVLLNCGLFQRDGAEHTGARAQQFGSHTGPLRYSSQFAQHGQHADWQGGPHRSPRFGVFHREVSAGRRIEVFQLAIGYKWG